MNDFDVSLVQKMYDLYKSFCAFRSSVPKQDKFTIWQRCEDIILNILECLFVATDTTKLEKLAALKHASSKLNVLRILLRLCKDTKALDGKKYIHLEQKVDEIGRMLGGWIRFANTR